jgi:hypothetical protein
MIRVTYFDLGYSGTGPFRVQRITVLGITLYNATKRH